MQYLIAFIAGLVGVLAGVWIGGGSGDSGDSGPAPQTTPATLTILSTAEQDALNLPFAEGTRVGDVIYLSGQIGARPGSMSLVEGGIKAETRQALENIQATLQRHGSDLDQVFKCTVFLLDMAGSRTLWQLAAGSQTRISGAAHSRFCELSEVALTASAEF